MKNAEAAENRTSETKKLAVDWAEKEWFKVWLRLARRDYHGSKKDNTLSRETSPVRAVA